MLRATRQHAATVIGTFEDTRAGTVAGRLMMTAAGIVTGPADTFTVIDSALLEIRQFLTPWAPVVAPSFHAGVI